MVIILQTTSSILVVMGTGNPNKLLRKSSDPQIGRTALVMATRRKIEKRLNGLRIGEMQTKDITLK